MSQIKILGLSDRVTEALEEANLSIQALLKMNRQQLIELPGIGATSADRIIAALDLWIESAIAHQAPKELIALPMVEEPVVIELLAACVWAQKVLQGIGGQRGMFLAGEMRMKLEAVQAQMGGPVIEEPLVTEIVP